MSGHVPGGVTTSGDALRPFFRQAVVKSALKALDEAPQLSVLAGSGVSSDAGLVGWEQLLNGLLRNTPGHDGTHEEFDAFASAAARAEGTLGRASLVEARFEGRSAEFAELVSNALTPAEQGSSQRPLVDEADGPGRTARALASLCVDVPAARAPVHLITTNFDLVLEQALLQAERKNQPESDVDPSVRAVSQAAAGNDPATRKWVVHHLHGWLPVPCNAAEETGHPTEFHHVVAGDNRIVLSETGYYSEQPTNAWQDRLIENVLDPGHTLLIVGTSLSDPALVRHLYRTAKRPHNTPRAYAVILRPEPILGQSEPGRDARARYEAIARERWNAVGVEVLFADYRFQIAQFCSELTLLRSGAVNKKGKDAARYGARLDTWFTKAFARGSLLSVESDGTEDDYLTASHTFQKRQQLLTEELRAVVNGLVVKPFEHLASDHLALHLWCRSPRRLRFGQVHDLLEGGLCALGMIGASDRSWADPESIDTRELHHTSDRLAVRAFCNQQLALTEAPLGSWDQLVAVPVTLEDGARRLPIGVISLNARSMTAGERTGLTKLLADPALTAQLTVRLARAGQSLLSSPSSPNA